VLTITSPDDPRPTPTPAVPEASDQARVSY
jgi:hypothetical protein